MIADDMSNYDEEGECEITKVMNQCFVRACDTDVVLVFVFQEHGRFL